MGFREEYSNTDAIAELVIDVKKNLNNNDSGLPLSRFEEGF